MKTLNLVYPENSDIKYQVQRFPDGQQNVVVLEETKNYLSRFSIQIKSRLNNWLDLELITCAVASLRELGVEEIHLYTPYIIGARSDRKFEEGGNNYLKDVICPIINSLNFKTVTCIDPHSDVLEACIKGFRKRNNLTLVDFFFISKYKTTSKNIHDKFILVSPDAGASKKIYKLAEEIGYKGDIIVCSKDRDENGNLTKQSIPNLDNDRFKHQNKDYIIIDDICDGGATFINLGKIIKNSRHQKCTGKTYLIVTHSIFSKGTNELLQYFDGIYTTNSYKEHDVEKVKVLNIF